VPHLGKLGGDEGRSVFHGSHRRSTSRRGIGVGRGLLSDNANRNR
jgi:hypothetical protein